MKLNVREVKWIPVVLLILMWGFSWPFLKIGVTYSPPVLFAGIRTFIGGAIIIPFAWQTRKRLQLKHTWKIYMISSLLNVVLFFGLQTIAVFYLPSGLVSVIVFLQPVLVGLFAWIWLGEILHWRKVIGLFLGFTGVALVSVEGFIGHVSLIGVLIALIASIGWGLGTVYMKSVQRRVDMIWLIALQFSIGGLLLSGVGSFFQNWAKIQWTPVFLWSLAYSSVIGVGLSWMIWIQLMYRGEVSRIATFTFLVPILAVISGIVFLHEPITVWLIGGLIFAALGIWFANRPQNMQVPLLEKICKK